MKTFLSLWGCLVITLASTLAMAGGSSYSSLPIYASPSNSTAGASCSRYTSEVPEFVDKTKFCVFDRARGTDGKSEDGMFMYAKCQFENDNELFNLKIPTKVAILLSQKDSKGIATAVKDFYRSRPCDTELGLDSEKIEKKLRPKSVN